MFGKYEILDFGIEFVDLWDKRRRSWGFISIIIINIINIEVSQMFKNTYQSGFLSILYSIGSKPLQIWSK